MALVRKTGVNTITVGGIEAIGSFDDLYDFIYNGTNEKYATAQ